MSRRFLRIVRWVGLVLLGVGVCLALLFLGAHLSFVQARVGRWAAARLASSGVAIETRAFSYNLASLTVHVEGLVVASTADRVEPFLEAARLDVQLPRSILSGRLAITSLTADGLRINVVRRKDGSTNLASSGGDGGPRPSRFDIGTLGVTNLSVDWRDDVLDASAHVEGLALGLRPDAAGSSGALTLPRPATIRVGGRTTTVAVAARLGWNGSRLSIASLSLEAPEATLTATGAVGALEDATPILLDARGSADVSRLTAWISSDQHPAGRVEYTVHATGTAADPTADVKLSTRDLGWQKLTNLGVDVSAHVDRTAADVSVLTVRAFGGTATGRGRVAWTPAAPQAALAEATFDWRDLDAARILAALDQRLPVAVRAQLDGHATTSLSAWRVDALTGSFDVTTRSAPGNAVALGLNGRAAIGARAGRFEGTFDQWIDRAVHLEGRAEGRLSPASPAASTIAATVAATADSWPELWGMLRRLDLVAIAPPAQLPGGARADLMLSGRLDNPTLAGHVNATLPDVSRLPVDAAQNLQQTGQLTLAANLAGTARNPTVDGQLMGEALSLAGQHFTGLEAAFTVAGQTAHVDSLTLRQDEGSLAGRGSYDWRTGQVTGTVTATNLTVNPVPGTQPGETLVPLRARLSGEWQSEGTIDAPRGSGHLELDETSVRDRTLGRVATRLTLADRRLQASVDLSDLYTTGSATLSLDAPGALVVDAQTTNADLAMIASRLGVVISAPVTGTASFATHVEGTRDDLARLRATVDLQRFDGTAGTVPVRAAQPAHASYDGRVLDIATLTLQVGTGELRASGQIGTGVPGTLAASLDAEARELQQLAAALLPADSALSRVQVDGKVHLDVRAPGSIDRPALTAAATVENGHAATPDQPVAADFSLRASYGDGMLRLAGLDAKWQDATVDVTGDIPIALIAPDAPRWLVDTPPAAQAAGRLRARLDSVTPAVIAPFVPAETLAQLSGFVSGMLTLDTDRLSWTAVHGQLLLDRVDLSVAGVPFNQQQPTRVDVADGRAQIVTWNWGGADNRVSLSGNLQFNGQPTLDVTLDGAIDLHAIGAFVPGTTADGVGVLKATFAGPLPDVRMDGRIDLQEAEWRSATPRLAISDFTGSIRLSGDRITFVDMGGHLNGGDVYVAGSLAHAGSRLTAGAITISGRSLAMAIPEPLKTEVDLELVLSVDRSALALGGTATVLGGAYREPISLASGVLQVLQASPALVQLDREPSALDAMTLDIRLTTADDIIVANNYAQLSLAADVRIAGTVAAPTLLGRAEAREGGRIFLGGNVYQIEDNGVIDFANPNRIEPDLSVTAKSSVGGFQITLNLSGTPANLETTLTSDPPLGQAEIISLLVTGQAQNAGALAVGGDQVIGLLSGEVLGVTGRALGLDALRVERGQDVRFDAGLVASETDPASRLTFGKQVTRTVELVFSQSLKDSGKLTWIIGYRPKGNVELRFVSQDNESRIYDFRHDVTIGDAGRRALPVKKPALRVASVAFTGTTDVSETVLRDWLKVKAGKDFDFFKWQGDRDRLEKRLREDAHFEARVSARRSSPPADASMVNLAYDLRRGPRTLVDISGTDRDKALRSDLERLWGQAVFDGFLLDEARNAVRAAMVRDGYVQAVVTTRIDRSSDGAAKHLVVEVERGPKYARPRLRFSGQQHVSVSRLEEVAGLGVSPWIDPAPFTRAVTTMYHNEGYLDATVSTGMPTFEGSTATLPVTISEGPLFELESVTFEGLHALNEEAAAKAFGLKAGAPLARASLDAAVEKLTQSYRAAGFEKARVVATSQATRATGRVALTLDVDEGMRQVLRDVSIEGTRRTSPALVSRELKLEVGKPVDLSALAQGRKRLYDTSMFRQVDVQAVPIETAAGPVGQVGQVDVNQPATGSSEAEQPTRARVSVDEWPPLRLRYGFEVEDEEGPANESHIVRPGVAADLTYRNVLGRAASTGLAVRYTKGFNAARVWWSMPSFLGLPLVTNVFVARSREEHGTDTANPFFVGKSDFTAEQRFRAGRRLQVAYSYNFERQQTKDVNFDPDNIGAIDVTTNVARLIGTALVDTRNDLVDATRGILTSATLEYGIGALGSDVRFAKFLFQQNYYRPLAGRLVFATSGRVGLAAGFEQELIPSERFYAGGSNSVRGFAQDALGPVSFFGVPTGGQSLLVVNEELRFPIAWRFRGVGFLDAGNTFDTIGEMRFSSLRAGGGVGLRVQTPFALLRGDIGTPIAPKPGESRLRFYFSIGQSF